MTTLADANAVLTPERVLPQHQAALTLLQSRLDDPSPARVRWLDIACGRGQILASMQSGLSHRARGKLEYFGFDVNDAYTRETQRLAETLHLLEVRTKVGDLADFDKLVPREPPFDFVTFTNSVHEVAPESLAAVVVDAVLRLSVNGTLFMYDMESLSPHELGAIPWRHDEFRAIVVALLKGLDCAEYEPEVGSWPHRTTKGWNVQIQRQFLNGHLTEKRDTAIASTSTALAEGMRRKLSSCQKALENLTKYGAETTNEREDQVRLLFEFWSLARALKVVQ